MDSIFDVSFKSPIKEGFCNGLFDDFCGSDTDYYVSKKVYQHREGDGLDFDYRYIISAIDMEDYCGEDEVCVSLAIVPEKSSLHSSLIDRVKVTTGLNDISEIGPIDIAEFGLSIIFGTQSFTHKEFEENEGRILDLAAAFAVDCCESLFGFYMDRYLNRIGTTGWDMADSWKTGECPFNAALNR